MRIACFLAALTIYLAADCAWAGEGMDVAGKSTTKTGWQAVPCDKDGNLIAARVIFNGRGEGRRVGETPVAIKEEYGIGVACRNGHPKAFYVFDNVNNAYFATRDFEQFLVQVKALPDKQTVAWVDSCTVHAYADLPQSKLERLMKVLTEKGIDSGTAVDGHFCYCVATSVRWLDVPGKKGNEPCEWVFTP